MELLRYITIQQTQNVLIYDETTDSIYMVSVPKNEIIFQVVSFKNPLLEIMQYIEKTIMSIIEIEESQKMAFVNEIIESNSQNQLSSLYELLGGTR